MNLIWSMLKGSKDRLSDSAEDRKLIVLVMAVSKSKMPKQFFTGPIKLVLPLLPNLGLYDFWQ